MAALRLLMLMLAAASAPEEGHGGGEPGGSHAVALESLRQAVLTSEGAGDFSRPTDDSAAEWVQYEQVIVAGAPATIGMLRFEANRMLRPDSLGFDATGAKVWAAGILLQMFLASEAGLALVRQRHCVELGTGTGIVSVAAARLGAASIVATDGNPAMTALAQFNAGRNLQPAQLRTFEAVPYVWGDPVQLPHAPFDTVLLTDVLYCKNVVDDDCSAAPLLAGVAAVCGVDCDVIISFERRDKKTSLQDAFFAGLRERGFAVNLSFVPEAELNALRFASIDPFRTPPHTVNGDKSNVRIARCRRRRIRPAAAAAAQQEL
jgi:SAM-dependent methyltransferase